MTYVNVCKDGYTTTIAEFDNRVKAELLRNEMRDCDWVGYYYISGTACSNWTT